MASTGNIRDEYVITARLDDQASAEADALATRLNAVEQAALREAAAFIQANQAQAAAAASFRTVGGSADQANKAVIGVGISAQSLVRRYDDITRAAVAAETSQRRLAAAQDTLNASPSDAGARALDKLAAIAATAQAKLESLQQTASQMAPAMTNVADAMSEAEKIQQRYAQGLDNLRSKFDPVFAAAQQYETALTAIADAQSVGAIKAHVASDATERATATYRDAAAAAREQTAALQQQNEAANRQLLGISDPDPQAAAKRAQDIEAYGKALDDLRARLSPLFAAQQQYADELALISKAQTTGAGTADEASAATERATARYRDAAAAAREQTAALQQQNEAANRQLLGISDPNPQATAARAADIEAYGKALDDLQEKFNPAIALQRQYEQSLEAIDQAQKVGAISAERAAEAQAAATTVFNRSTATIKEFGGTTGQTGFAVRQFGVQMTQAISGIATGQPIFQTFIQQGHQMVDVALATGTGFNVLGLAAKAAYGAIGGLPGLIGIGVVGALAAATISMEVQSRQLRSLQAVIRGVSGNYKELAQQGQNAARNLSGSSTITTADANSAVRTILSSGNYSGTQAQLENLIRVANDAKTVMGISLPEAAKKFADGLQDPGKLAQELADKHLFGMNQQLANSILRMQNAGDKGSAFAAILTQMKKAAGAAIEALTPFQTLVNDISNALETGIHKLQDYSGAAYDFLKKQAQDADAVKEQLRSQGGALNGPGPITGAGGQVLTSAAGALGLFQVIPGTAARFNVSRQQLADPNTNVFTGLSEINRLADIHGATNFGAIAHGYNPGSSIYPSQVANADASKLPTDVVSMIDEWGRILHMPPELIAFGKRVATVESGGHQFGPDYSQGNSLTVRAPAPVGPADVRKDAIAGSLFTAGGDTGVGGPVNDIVRDALNEAKGLGTVAESAQKAHDQVIKFTAALAAERSSAHPSADAIAILSDALDKARTAYRDAVPEVQKLIDTNDRQAASQNQIADAYKSGFGAVQEATASQQAQVQVYQAGVTGADKFAAATNQVTASILRKNAADQNTQGRAVIADQQQQLQFLQAESATLGESADQRARDLATLKQQQEIEKQRPNEIQAIKDAEIANAQALASSTFELQNQQNAWNEIGNIVQSISDNIAQALTNAFVSGQGAAVSFGNVAKAVMTQVLQEVLKLSVINPILNSITGGTAVTGAGVLSVLGLGGGGGGLGLAAAGLGAFSATGPGSFGSGRGTSGGEALIDGSFAPGGATFESSSRSGGGFGGASNILSAGSGLSKLLGFDIGKELGLTGPNGLFSGVSNILGGGIFGTSAAEANTAGLIAGGFGPGQALGVVNAAPTGILGGVSVGSLLGGIGAGFGVGSLAGGFVQNALGKVGPAPTIGAGLGAAGGAALGSIIPGVGTIIGGLIGGLLGGGGGGLIGPKAPSPFAVGTYLIDPTTGQLKQGAFAQQKENGLPILQQLQGEISGINQVLSGGGARITTTGGKFFIGDDQKNAAIQDRSAITASIADAFSGFRFTGNDQPTSTLLQGRSFGDLNELNQILGTFKNFTASLTAAGHSDLIQKFTDSLGGLTNSAIPAQLDQINQFVVATVPALEAFNKQTGSFADAINNINSQFNPAIQTAHELGYAESDLASARDLAIQKVQEATDRQLQNIGQGYANRYAAAAATISGSPTDALNAQLQSFDLQATNERQGLTDQLVGIFGDSIKTQQFYADEMANLDKTLAEERLAIQKQSNQQLLSQAATLITSLADYTRNLQFSQASPLSPQDQLSLAQKDFNAVSGSALAGDANSLSKLTQYSDTLLNAGRAVYGSGQGYADLFKSVVDTLNKVSEVPIDTLTASIFQMETRTQTTILESAINDLKSEVTALRAQLNTGALTPDRLAA